MAARARLLALNSVGRVTSWNRAARPKQAMPGVDQIVHLGAVNGKQQAHQNQRHRQPGADVGNGDNGGAKPDGGVAHGVLAPHVRPRGRATPMAAVEVLS